MTAARFEALCRTGYLALFAGALIAFAIFQEGALAARLVEASMILCTGRLAARLLQ